VSTAFTIQPAGDAALMVARPPAIDAGVNAWCVALAGAAREALGAAVRDAVVGYCTVTIYFDPLQSDGVALERELAALASSLPEALPRSGALLEIPVSYGGDDGPDLARVAAFGSCSEEDVIRRHTERDYRVYMLGFVPGFAYLAEVDPRIAAPRLASPRTRVPAGSVAIAGPQTGVYPAVTPGGWNVIGRTAVRPFDPGRREPFLLRPGDRVRFRRVNAAEIESLAEAVWQRSA
jgi:KipI family sensor histidine kinase inhibitor